MKFIALQENITNALTLASKFLPSKNTSLPTVSNFHLSSKNGVMTVMATDLEAAIQITIPGKVEEEGEMLLPSKTGLSLISSLHGEKIVLSSEGEKISIKGKNSQVTLRTEKPQDFPDLMKDKKGEKVKMKKKLIESIYQKVAFAASTDQARAVLNGVLFDVSEEGISLVATDGFRLASLKEKRENAGVGSSILLPAKVLQVLAGVVKGSKEEFVEVLIAEGGSQVFFTLPDARIAARIIEGTFPEYQRIIPKENSIRATVDADDLLKAVRFASVLARESSNIVKLRFDDKSVVVSANAPQTGDNKTTIEAQVEGEPVEAAFNFRFLIDFLSLGIDKEVIFETNGSLSPGVFSFNKNPNYTYIVMPVRLQDAE